MAVPNPNPQESGDAFGDQDDDDVIMMWILGGNATSQPVSGNGPLPLS